MESHSVGVGFIKLLLVLVTMWQNSAEYGLGMEHQFLGSDDSNSTSSPFSVLLQLSYPNVKIGPYGWRYFRVDVPQAFAKFTVAFTRKWTGEHIGDHSSKVPLVCFRHGALPSPNIILESLEAATIAAGRAQNVAETGNCAWFYNSSSVVLTNMQISGGVWYIGVFSDTQPSRYQLKMITRGSIFIFGIHMTVLGCKLQNLIGRDCNSSITQLCTTKLAASLHSNFRNSHSNSQEADENFNPPGENDLQINQPVHSRDRWSEGDEGSWESLKLQRVGPGAWKYFSLEIADYFPARLEIRAECTNSSRRVPTAGSGSGEEEEVGKLYLNFGRLPIEGDEFSVVKDSSSLPISVSAPRRGQWFMGVRGNSNLTTTLEFALFWRVSSCPYGTAGENCTSVVNFLERELTDDTYESPFDSHFVPTAAIGGDSLPPSPAWFPISPYEGSNGSSSQVSGAADASWTYFHVHVPRGAAGAVLSIELRHVAASSMRGAALYARWEGAPTHQAWDSKASSHQAHNSPTLSLDLVYPVEGTWCVGVRIFVPEGNGGLSQNAVALRTVPCHRQVTLHFRHLWAVSKWWTTVTRHCQVTSHFRHLWGDVARALSKWSSSGRTVTGISSPFWTLWNSVDSQSGEDMGPGGDDSNGEFPMSEDGAPLQFGSDPTKKRIERMVSSGNEGLEEQIAGKRQGPQLRITIHGCVNGCSGRGTCISTYESSHLYFYSYCHCDSAHGGVDCSVRLIVPLEEILHIWALIGSNFAALLPSVWAIQQHAYSEWVAYSASGMASAIYHSCDVGGWCALSYDTLKGRVSGALAAQFLDFWLAYLVVVVTCLYVATFKQATKAVAHLGAAIITAAAIKEDATSAWNLLLVVLMGVAGLVLGWAMAYCKQDSIPTWLRTLRPPWRSIRFNSLYRRGQRFVRHLYGRFRWFYLAIGLSILVAAAMSWALETDTTYWLWHSLWHVSIYTSTFMILCSTTKTPCPSQGQASVSQEPSDMENLPMLRHTVELDEFAIDNDM